MSVNRVFLIGRVGQDPEVIHLDSGATVAKLSLATNETYKNKQGEKVEDTTWHNIVAWRGIAEVIEKYVKKGDQVYFDGKIKNRSWTDKDGNKKWTTEVVVDNIELLGGKRESNHQNTPMPSEDDMPENTPEDDSDLPF